MSKASNKGFQAVEPYVVGTPNAAEQEKARKKEEKQKELVEKSKKIRKRK